MTQKKNISRRDFLRAIGFGASALAMPRWLQAGEASKNKPNIIFIMSDDHDCQALSCYGSKINKTPNLDRLAKEGIRFNNCFCTNSICGPSRAVILTGKYSHINGITKNGMSFDGSQQTFVKLLQSTGYETAIIGKWHLHSEPTGFDYWNVLMGWSGQGRYFDPLFSENGRERAVHGYVTDIITDNCIRWLKGRKADKPFCLMCHHKAPHRRWMPDMKHIKMYEDIDIPVPETFDDDYKTRSKTAGATEMTIEHHLNALDLKLEPPKGLSGPALKHWKYERYIKDYLRCVASVDDNVGRLLDYLDESGLAENTIVVYTSDQGFYLGNHGWFDKRFMYEESLRMPLLVRYPGGIKPGMVSEEMVLNLDFASTFLDFAGVAKPAEMQGRSFRPILKGKTPTDWRTSMYYHYYEYPAVHMVKRHYGVRTQRYKLIHFYYDVDIWELYDLQKDPHELNNVYDNPAYADIIKRLKVELKRLQKQYGDSDELAKKFLQEDLEKQRQRRQQRK